MSNSIKAIVGAEIDDDLVFASGLRGLLKAERAGGCAEYGDAAGGQQSGAHGSRRAADGQRIHVGFSRMSCGSQIVEERRRRVGDYCAVGKYCGRG